MNTDDIQRLDELFRSARRYHHFSLMLASLSILITALGDFKSFILSFGNIDIPKLHATIFIYFLAIFFASLSRHFFLVSYPFLKTDKRTVPFAWVATSRNPPSIAAVTLWLILPLVICSISTTLNLKQDKVGVSLAVLSLLAFLLPKNISNRIQNIVKKQDHRGGKATLSIYIYQYYQIFKNIFFLFFLYLPVLAIIPEWRDTFAPIGNVLIYIIPMGIVLRLIFAIGFVYRKIDKFGVRFGFASKSSHNV